MADTAKLKDMLQDLINDRTEQAEVNLHDYLTGKMQEIAGTAKQPEIEPKSIETDEPEVDTQETADTED